MTSTRHGAAQPEVLIVGAGLTGLTLANELARYGVAFRIVDKVPTSPSTPRRSASRSERSS